MQKAATASGPHRRTILRLENDERYAQAQPTSLRKLVALYRQQRIILEDCDFALADEVAEPAFIPTLNMRLESTAPRGMGPKS